MSDCLAWFRTCLLVALGLAFTGITVWMAQTQVRGFQAIHARPEVSVGSSCAGPMEEMRAQMAKLTQEVTALSVRVSSGGGASSQMNQFVSLKAELLQVLRTELREQLHGMSQGASSTKINDGLASRLPVMERDIHADMKRMLDNVKKNISGVEQEVMQAMALVRAATLVDVKAADRAAKGVKDILGEEIRDLKMELIKDTENLHRELHAGVKAETASLKKGFAAMKAEVNKVIPALEAQTLKQEDYLVKSEAAMESHLVTSLKKEGLGAPGSAAAGSVAFQARGCPPPVATKRVCPNGTKTCLSCPVCPAVPANASRAVVSMAANATPPPAKPCPVCQKCAVCPPRKKPSPICGEYPHGFSGGRRAQPYVRLGPSQYRVVKHSDAKWLAASVARPAPYNDLIFTTWQGYNLFTRYWLAHLGAVGLHKNALMLTYKQSDCIGLPRDQCYVHDLPDMLSVMREKAPPPCNGGHICGGGVAVVGKWTWTLAFLRAGYNVLFSDSDVAFVRSPFEYWRREKPSKFDIMGLSDWRPYGIPSLPYCNGADPAHYGVHCQSTGIMFFKTNNRTTGVVERMVKQATPPWRVWEQALWQKFIPQIANVHKGTYQLLPTAKFMNIDWVKQYNPEAFAVHLGFMEGFCPKLHSFWCIGLGVTGLEEETEKACKGAAIW